MEGPVPGLPGRGPRVEPLANLLDGCVYAIVGCRNDMARNYDPLVNVHDESTCFFVNPGCTDPLGLDYSVLYNDPRECTYPIKGCMDTLARNFVVDANFNDHLRSCMREDDLDVLTIHAESEGGAKAELFERFLDQFIADGGEVVPLGDLLPSDPEPGTLEHGHVPGRDGWLAVRGSIASNT